MPDPIFTILLIIGAVVVGVLIFGGWVTVSIVRLIWRGLFGNPSAGSLPMPPPRFVRCVHRNCATDNPESARFCRRCGRMLHEQPAVARKVAMW